MPPLKFGLEKEFFVYRSVEQVREYVLASQEKLPYDECGYLAEVRGLPSSNISDAVFNLRSKIREVEKVANSSGLTIDDTPIMRLPNSLLYNARRHHVKGVISYRNLKGFTQHRNAKSEQTAGVHISVTQEFEYLDEGRNKRICMVNFDWPAIFWRLDAAFKEEIKVAKRNPGFYEVKPDGRVEYRSLPSNIDLDKVIDVIQDICKELYS